MNNSKKTLPVIAKNIRKLRNKLGISQDKLSKLADVSFHTITKIEAGETPNPTIGTVKKIAKALGIGVDDLIKK
jgi:transcriptional regulator with XRE-family HTH domain